MLIYAVAPFTVQAMMSRFSHCLAPRPKPHIGCTDLRYLVVSPLFVIIFCETGLCHHAVFARGLPALCLGAAAASGIVNLELLIRGLHSRCGYRGYGQYWLGNYIGLKSFMEKFPGLIKKEYIERTHCSTTGGEELPSLSPGSCPLSGPLRHSWPVSVP